MLKGASRSLVVEDARHDASFADLACTEQLGIGAYTGVPLYRADGQLYGTLCTLHTEARQVDPQETALLALAGRIIIQAVDAEALRESEHAYAELVQQSPDAIIAIDLTGKLLAFNPSAESMTGYDAQEILEKDVEAAGILTEQSARRLLDEFALSLEGEERAPFDLEMVRRDGSLLPVEGNLRRMRHNGRSGGAQISLRDTTERKKMETQPDHHDSLTGLPDRVLFEDRLGQTLALAERHGDTFGLLALDLDGLGAINDLRGQEVGDEVLRAVAERIRAGLRRSDILARVGGDDFAVILPRMGHGPNTSRHGASTVASRLIDACHGPFTVRGRQCSVTLNLGISLYPADGKDAEEILCQTLAAVRAAKRRGANTYCFAGDIDSGGASSAPPQAST